jgi:hypothetical protein
MGRWVCSVLVSLTCWLSVVVQAVAQQSVEAVALAVICTLLEFTFLPDHKL